MKKVFLMAFSLLLLGCSSDNDTVIPAVALPPRVTSYNPANMHYPATADNGNNRVELQYQNNRVVRRVEPSSTTVILLDDQHRLTHRININTDGFQ